MILIVVISFNYLEWIDFLLQSVITNAVALIALEITQFVYQVRIRLILRSIKDIHEYSENYLDTKVLRHHYFYIFCTCNIGRASYFCVELEWIHNITRTITILSITIITIHLQIICFFKSLSIAFFSLMQSVNDVQFLDVKSFIFSVCYCLSNNCYSSFYKYACITLIK